MVDRGWAGAGAEAATGVGAAGDTGRDAVRGRVGPGAGDGAGDGRNSATIREANDIRGSLLLLGISDV